MSGAQGLDVTMASALSPKKDAGLPETCGEVPAKECVMGKKNPAHREGASGLSIREAGLSEPKPQSWSYRESSRPQAASSKTF